MISNSDSVDYLWLQNQNPFFAPKRPMLRSFLLWAPRTRRWHRGRRDHGGHDDGGDLESRWMCRGPGWCPSKAWDAQGEQVLNGSETPTLESVTTFQGRVPVLGT